MSYPLTDEHRVLNELQGWQTTMKDWVAHAIQRTDDQANRIASAFEAALASGTAATAKPKHIDSLGCVVRVGTSRTGRSEQR